MLKWILVSLMCLTGKRQVSDKLHSGMNEVLSALIPQLVNE